MIRVTLSGNQPIRFDYVPQGTTPQANEVVYADNVPPSDFAMNFHTYIVVSGSLVRNAGVPIDNRILTAPVFTYPKAADKACDVASII